MASLSSSEFERLLVTAAFAALVVLASAMPAHNDTWWHLRAGLDTVQGHSPFVERYSWTVPGSFFWNHSWLAQIVFHFVHRAGGLPLLTALCASAVVVSWWLVWRQCRGSDTERLLLMTGALSVSTVTWSIRPQVAIVLLPVLVALVARNRALTTGLVMAVWANLHAGFALGVLVLAAGVASALLFDRPALIGRLVTAAAGAVATLATPLGLANWNEIALSLGRSRANAIIEWQPPGFAGPHLVFWAIAAAFVVLALTRWRRLDSAYLQVSALGACLALLAATRAVRNIPGFMMLALPPLSAMVFSGRLAQGAPLSSRLRAVQGVTAAAATVAIAWIWTHPTRAMGWHPISREARAAIAACPRPMFNTYALGGPIIWFVPSQRVFVDSRQDPYPVELVQEAVRVEHQGRYQPLFDERGVRCAVLPPSSPAVERLVRDGWVVRSSDLELVVLERPAGQLSSGMK